MSARWEWNSKDIKSAARHVILPLVAGGAVAALQAAQSGSFDVVAIKGAALTSLIAGVIRLLQRWSADTPDGSH